MALSKKEATIFEAISNFLKGPELGLKDDAKGDPVDRVNGGHFNWSNIDLYFRAKLNEATDHRFIDAICGAFAQAHSYMFLDNPRFETSFEQNMRSAQYAIPAAERERAVKILREVSKEMVETSPGERDNGWNPALDEIVEMTRNADTHKGKMTEPFSGGGPAPKDGKRDPGKGVANHPGTAPSA